MSSKLAQYNPQVATKRRERDIMKLLMSDYKVIQSKEYSSHFSVQFQGPKSSLYENGIWTVHVILPEQYPYKSPSIGFIDKIWHPNIDEASGSVCLDVINQTWSPMYDLINVFDIFLPQLLTYPNPSDPLNPDAASMLIHDEKKYEQKVKEYIRKYCELIKKVEQKQQVKETLASGEDKKEQSNADSIEEEAISDISMDNVSELSQHSQLDLDYELVCNY